MLHGCPGKGLSCEGTVEDLQERAGVLADPDSHLLQCRMCHAVVQECPCCLELALDSRYCNSQQSDSDAYESTATQRAVLPQWKSLSTGDLPGMSEDHDSGPWTNNLGHVPSVENSAGSKDLHKRYNGQWTSCLWCGYTFPLLGSRLHQTLTADGHEPARFHSIRRFFTAALGRERYLAGLVAQAQAVQARGQSLLGVMRQTRGKKRTAATSQRPTKSPRRSTQQASPSLSLSDVNSDLSSPLKDGQALPHSFLATEELPIWEIDEETDSAVLEAELRRLMHNVQLAQAPSIQREDDKWLYNITKRRPVEPFTLAHLCQLRALYQTESSLSASSKFLLSKVEMFLEKRSGLEALRASTACAGTAWKRLVSTRECGPVDRPLTVDSDYVKPNAENILTSAPFEFPRVHQASRRMAANILYYRYQRLQELMNYNSEPLLSYMGAINMEVKELYRDLLRAQPRAPCTSSSALSEIQESNDESSMKTHARFASISNRLHLWSLLYKTISPAMQM